MTTVLKSGSAGEAVRELQQMLNAAGASPKLRVDGDFGANTDNAVRSFQKRFGLVVDGKAGSQTMKALRRAVTPVKPGRAEPDKGAMAQPVPALLNIRATAAPPPNVDSLVLLDTARPIDEIDWHCAATPEGKDFTVADIRAWHKARGWSDIGYHYVVYRDGRVMLGRPIGQVGAHIEGHNTGKIGCVYIGGLSADGKTPKDTRSAAQRSSMLWLTRALARKHPIKRVRGHNDYTSAKACPSFRVGNDALGQLAA